VSFEFNSASILVIKSSWAIRKLKKVLGEQVPVASLANITRGKIWAWSDKARRPTKRKKDELDLMRILEGYPELRPMMPSEINEQVPEA